MSRQDLLPRLNGMIQEVEKYKKEGRDTGELQEGIEGLIKEAEQVRAELKDDIKAQEEGLAEQDQRVGDLDYIYKEKIILLSKELLSIELSSNQTKPSPVIKV